MKNSKSLGKRGEAEMGKAIGWVVGFTVLLITFAVVSIIVDSIYTSQDTSANSSAENASRQGNVGLTNFGSLIGVIGTILIAIVVIGIVLGGMSSVKFQ